jgi:hypothetical protein
MRKSFWIVLALLVAGAPVAHADSFAATFTGGPTAPDVTFPSPTLTISFDGSTFSITLPSADLPTDQYTWSKAPSVCGVCGTAFVITDQTTNMATSGGGSISTEGASGDLTFTPLTAPAPEPSSLALIPVGLGALLVMRRRMGHSRPSDV